MTVEEALAEFIVVTKEKFLEADKRFEKLENLLNEKFQETDRLLTQKFQETDRLLTEKFQETDRLLTQKFQETDRLLTQKFQETDRLLTEKFQETDRLLTQKFQETDRILTEKFQETDKKFKETDKRFKETDDKLRRLEGLFVSQWGKLIEALVRPGTLKIFRERGIDVHHLTQRVEVEKEDIQKEFDIILVNGDVIVVIEVKTTLKVADVNEHIEDLKHITEYLPEYKGKKVLGGIAYINCEEEADKYAYRNGLFVITLSGENLIEIKNDKKFVPVDFSIKDNL